MTSQSTRLRRAQAVSHGNLNRLVFFLSGILLSATSISVAALAGWNRGASTPESAIWAGAGVGLSLAALAAPSMLVVVRGWSRAATASIYALSLIFVIVAALGSQHAGRQVASSTEHAAAGERTRHEAAYKRATDALAALPVTRPQGVIEAELDAILRDPRLHGCEGWLASVKLRTVCIERVEPARAELANARERERLQGTMTEAMEALGEIQPGKPASADAAALGRYLGLFGIEPATDRIADAVNLLVVLATEIGGGLALMLARSTAVGDGATGADHMQPGQLSPRRGGPLVRKPAGPLLPAPVQPVNAGGPGGPRSEIVTRLQGGPVQGGQRDLADLFGLPKTSFRRELDRLVEAGVVRAEVGRTGTRLELA